MPGGASGDGKTWWPLFFAGAHGSHVVDVDGNDYIDLVLGIGPNMLGHTDSAVVDAVHECFSSVGELSPRAPRWRWSWPSGSRA